MSQIGAHSLRFVGTLFEYIDQSPTERGVTPMMRTTQIVISALHYLQVQETLQMLHRDITGHTRDTHGTHNIMVHDDDRKIKLIDFSLAKAVNTTAYTGWYFTLHQQGEVCR